MPKTDIQRLNVAAKQIAAGLKLLKLPGLQFESRAIADGKQNDNGGWAVGVARWRGQPSIAVSLDKYAYSSQRVFWVGFWSKKAELIKKLYKNQPKLLATLNEDSAEERDGIYVLKRPLAQSQFNRPIAEHYEDENDFGYYESSDELNVARAVEFIADVVVGQQNGVDDELVDIQLIEQNADLKETQKEQLIQARRGQGKFRKQLEAIWRACPVTGHRTAELLRASHIMPWREADNRQRLDRNNGILLAATLDALFDKYLISFSDDGKLLISDLLPAEEVDRLQLTRDIRIDFSDEQKRYLKHHRLQFEHKHV